MVYTRYSIYAVARKNGAYIVSSSSGSRHSQVVRQTDSQADKRWWLIPC